MVHPMSTSWASSWINIPLVSLPGNESESASDNHRSSQASCWMASRERRQTGFPAGAPGSEWPSQPSGTCAIPPLGFPSVCSQAPGRCWAGRRNWPAKIRCYEQIIYVSTTEGCPFLHFLFIYSWEQMSPLQDMRDSLWHGVICSALLGASV